MADYNVLKAAIADYVKDRTGLSTIDGDGLQETLLAMVNSLGANYQFAGVAKLTPTQTDPGTPDQNVFYIAAEPGTYTNFPISGGSLQVAENEVAIFKYNGQWSKETTCAASVNALLTKGSIFGVPHKGYINNGIWEDLLTSFRKHVVFEVAGNFDNAPLTIKGSPNGASVVCFLNAYNPVEDGDAGVLLQLAVPANGIVNDFVPVGTKYIYCLYESETNRLPAQLIVNGVDLTKETAHVALAGIAALNELRKTPYKVFSLGEKPNVNTQNNTLFFANATTIDVGGKEYTVPANTSVSLVASGTVYSTILYNLKTGAFSAVGRFSTYDQYENIVIGFAVTGGENTKKRYYFPFSYTIDGADVESLAAQLSELSRDVEEMEKTSVSFPIPTFELGNILWSNGHIVYGNAETRIRTKQDVFYSCDYDAEITLSDYTNAKLGIFWKNSAGEDEGRDVWINSGKRTLVAGKKYAFIIAYKDDAQITDIDALASLLQITQPLKVVTEKVNELYDGQSGVSILALNPRNKVETVLKNLKVGYVNYGVSDNFPPVFSLLHFSDLHDNNVNLLRISEFFNKYAENIDDVIQTGDLVGAVITDHVPESWPTVGADWLSVIGNHDATIRVNNVWTTVSAKDSYDEIIAPYVANWGVVQPAGAGEGGYYPCYYYKNYTVSNLRLIVLDNMQSLNDGPTHWDNTQKTWFESVLADARTNGLDVIVAVHYVPFAISHNPANPFDSISVRPDNAGWHVSQEIPQAVKSFIDAGGNFVCYISGHTHCDYFGVAQNADWANQLSIGVASASNSTGTIYNDADRSVGTKGQDCFNIIGIDTQSKTIKLVRIGLEYDKYMRRKNTLCWDYANSQLIYVD